MATKNVQVLVRKVVDEYVDVPVDAELLERSGVVQNEDGTFYQEGVLNSAYGELSGAITEYVMNNIDPAPISWFHE